MRSVSLKISHPHLTTFEQDRRFQMSALKLYWAKMHAHHLSAIWEQRVEMHYTAAVGGDVKLGYSLDKHLLQPPISYEMPLLMGDCIRNLRSALDYLVSQLARDVSLSDNYVTFPFARTLGDLKASFNEPRAGDEHRKGRRAGALYDVSRKYPDLERVILEVIRPHEGTDGSNPMGDLLWRVITSDNIDKHRLMMPSVTRAKTGAVYLTNEIFFSGVSLEGASLAFAPGVRLKKNSDLSVDVVFKEPASLAGKPVFSTLVEVSDQVRGVIEIFRREFPAIK